MPLNIRSPRQNAGLTQKQLADAVGVDVSTVTKWETNAATPRADKLPQIAKVLGCTVDELLEHTSA